MTKYKDAGPGSSLNASEYLKNDGSFLSQFTLNDGDGQKFSNLSGRARGLLALLALAQQVERPWSRCYTCRVINK